MICVTGNGFLYNMVRIIAGTLIRVGRGFYAPEKIKEILEKKVHTSEGVTAPAERISAGENRLQTAGTIYNPAHIWNRE